MSDKNYLQCNGCGWYSDKESADESVIESGECPQCGDELNDHE